MKPKSTYTEYKSKLTANFESEMVAFLNSRNGGEIFLGIADDGEVVGLKDIDEAQLQIKDRLKNNILPSCLGLFSLAVEKIEGKSVIRIVEAIGLLLKETIVNYYYDSKEERIKLR